MSSAIAVGLLTGLLGRYLHRVALLELLALACYSVSLAMEAGAQLLFGEPIPEAGTTVSGAYDFIG